MLRQIALAVIASCAPLTVYASTLEQSLARLDPQERSHQACIIKGLDVVQHDAHLRRADRIKTSIATPAILKGTVLTAKGAAVRAHDRWYALSFTCRLSPDFMKATSFSFVLGAEIPKENWEKEGLWR